jgi:hypothetical protein
MMTSNEDVTNSNVKEDKNEDQEDENDSQTDTPKTLFYKRRQGKPL